MGFVGSHRTDTGTHRGFGQGTEARGLAEQSAGARQAAERSGLVAAIPWEPLKAGEISLEQKSRGFAPDKGVCKVFKREWSQHRKTKKPPSPSPILMGLGGTLHHRPARKSVFPNRTPLTATKNQSTSSTATATPA